LISAKIASHSCRIFGHQQQHPVAALHSQLAEVISHLVRTSREHAEGQLLVGASADAPQREIVGRQVVEVVERPVESVQNRPAELSYRLVVIGAQPQQQIARSDKRLRVIRHHGASPVLNAFSRHSPNCRQFEARIAILFGLDNGKSPWMGLPPPQIS
jgi:hypothetical protein